MKIIYKLMFFLLIVMPTHQFAMQSDNETESKISNIYAQCIKFLAQDQFYNTENNPQLSTKKLLEHKDQLKKISSLHMNFDINNFVDCLKNIEVCRSVSNDTTSDAKQIIETQFLAIEKSWKEIEPLSLAYNDILKKLNVEVTVPAGYEQYMRYAHSIANLDQLNAQSQEIFKQMIHLLRALPRVIKQLTPQEVLIINSRTTDYRNLMQALGMYKSLAFNMNRMFVLSRRDMVGLINAYLQIKDIHESLYECWRSLLGLRNTIDAFAKKLNLTIDTKIDETPFRQAQAEQAFQDCIATTKRMQLVLELDSSALNNKKIKSFFAIIENSIVDQHLVNYYKYLDNMYNAMTKEDTEKHVLNTKIAADKFTKEWYAQKESLERIISFIEQSATNIR